jgi:hypothetical protein
MRVGRLYPTRPRSSDTVTRPTAEASPRYRHVRQPPHGVTDVSSSALPVRTLNPPPRRRMARTGLEHRGKTAPSAERMCTEGSTSFPGAAMPQSSRKTATRSRRSWMRDCIRNESSLSMRQERIPHTSGRRSSGALAHTRESPQPRARKTLLLPVIPAYPHSTRRRHARPVTPEVLVSEADSGLAHVGTGKPSGLRCEPGKVQFVVCFANGQHTAGTRRVTSSGHARALVTRSAEAICRTNVLANDRACMPVPSQNLHGK